MAVASTPKLAGRRVDVQCAAGGRDHSSATGRRMEFADEGDGMSRTTILTAVGGTLAFGED